MVERVDQRIVDQLHSFSTDRPSARPCPIEPGGGGKGQQGHHDLRRRGWPAATQQRPAPTARRARARRSTGPAAATPPASRPPARWPARLRPGRFRPPRAHKRRLPTGGGCGYRPHTCADVPGNGAGGPYRGRLCATSARAGSPRRCSAISPDPTQPRTVQTSCSSEMPSGL